MKKYRFEDIRLRSCYDPPQKSILVTELCKIARRKKINLGFDEESKNLPPKSWLVCVLSTLCPTHPVSTQLQDYSEKLC